MLYMYACRFQELLIVWIMTWADRQRRKGDNQSVMFMIIDSKSCSL